MRTRWSESHAMVGFGPERLAMRPSFIIAVSLFVLVGCGGNGGGPVSMMSPQAGAGHGGAVSSTQQSRPDGEHSVSGAQQLPIGGRVHAAEVRSSVGAPVIYSTTGGPLPDGERAGQVQIGANVIPLPDWKRPERWNDPINGVSISTGRTYDGARAARIAEYVIPHIDDKWEPQGYENEPTTDTPGLATFPNQPVLRLAEGTSDEHTAYALHAAALINSTLPHNKRILIGPEAPRLVSVDAIPDGQIFVDFATHSDWIPASETSALHAPSYDYDWDPSSQRWEIKGMRAGHVWIDPDAFHTQAEFVRVLVHEMLHALGLRGHSLVDQFPESILRNAYSTVLPTDNHVPEIDADGLLAIYTRLAPGAEPSSFTATNLAPWGNESLRMHGELDTPEGAAFGVAFRNDFARPWAYGPEPLSPVSENQSLDGSATWDGALLGFTPEGHSVAGDAEISVDFGPLTGRADFTDLEEWSSPKWQDAGQWSMWGDGDLAYTIAVSGNTIRETGGDEGILTGSFVGRQHEGAVGTLERPDLSAAFGGSKTTTTSDTGSNTNGNAEAATDENAEYNSDRVDRIDHVNLSGGYTTNWSPGPDDQRQFYNPWTTVPHKKYNEMIYVEAECSGTYCQLKQAERAGNQSRPTASMQNYYHRRGDSQEIYTAGGMYYPEIYERRRDEWPFPDLESIREKSLDTTISTIDRHLTEQHDRLILDGGFENFQRELVGDNGTVISTRSVANCREDSCPSAPGSDYISYTGYGAWMDHSGFFVLDVFGPDSRFDGGWHPLAGAFAIAGGSRSGTRPDYSATYRGVMTARIPQRENGIVHNQSGSTGDHLIGNADLIFYSTRNTISVQFSNIESRHPLGTYGGPTAFGFSDVPVDANGIFSSVGTPSAAAGKLQGAFYGLRSVGNPGRENAEVAGIFERNAMVGAFGAKRASGPVQ